MGKRSLEEGEEQQQQKKQKQQKKPSNMLVSFSKRRDGLFKKASELCVKCGAQIAIVILSPAGIPHAFGHTSVDEVLQHYLHQTTIIPRCLTDEHKHQNRRIEGLKYSRKQERKLESMDEESKVVMGLKHWIENEVEDDCKTSTDVEELEFLKQKYLVLLDQINQRILGYDSSTWSVESGKEVVTSSGCTPFSIEEVITSSSSNPFTTEEVITSSGNTPFSTEEEYFDFDFDTTSFEEEFGISLADLWS
ncbi:agamous-like MADS-box protein AGL29 [Cannabis sativa]|uniref:agamous-like MADS-box protein AGL29 n=1 Tax=Cannabis sativa TaxID=3483 RepID=UPI0029CA0ECD|nr:agamous-like MADS-box protein AGL29 [Cannabis sativa]XP_060958425.1 agamous-like MADS-box protein AGL29 [Cannabis sativa]XP_060958426.1 agamous-like MADS-box protein AGL29 [Cannabis sativa]XP_060958427.1 agamous-like MADS-box protein AGL29 [Cannabis sativa]